MWPPGEAPPVGLDRNGREILIGCLVATVDEHCGRVIGTKRRGELVAVALGPGHLGVYLLDAVAVLPEPRR